MECGHLCVDFYHFSKIFAGLIIFLACKYSVQMQFITINRFLKFSLLVLAPVYSLLLAPACC